MFGISMLVWLTLVGGCLYYFRGSDVKWPRPAKQFLYCIIFIIVGFFAGEYWFINLVASMLAVSATCLGHGQYFLNMECKHVKAEKIDPIVSFLSSKFMKYDPRVQPKEIPITCKLINWSRLYWRCAIGLTLSGLLISLVPGIALIMVGSPLYGILLALSGATKGPAYMASFALFGEGEWDDIFREFFTGAIQWCIAALVIYQVL